MSKRILIAPLNWGLGHATRCIPIIKELIHNNFEPVIGSDGSLTGYAGGLYRKQWLLEHESPYKQQSLF